MRFMMLMIPEGYENAERGAMPDAKAVAAMMKYNESLQKADVLLALDGLHSPSMGARVSFAGGKPKVTDGPFAEAKEVPHRQPDSLARVAKRQDEITTAPAPRKSRLATHRHGDSAPVGSH